MRLVSGERKIVTRRDFDGEIPEEAWERAAIILGNPTPAQLQNCGALKLLQLQSAGADNYCKPGVLPESVALCNATGSYGVAIAEYMGRGDADDGQKTSTSTATSSLPGSGVTWGRSSRSRGAGCWSWGWGISAPNTPSGCTPSERILPASPAPIRRGRLLSQKMAVTEELDQLLRRPILSPCRCRAATGLGGFWAKSRSG